MASLKAVKPQSSSPAATAPPKVQQAKTGGAKPAPGKVVLKSHQPKKVLVPKAAPQAK